MALLSAAPASPLFRILSLTLYCCSNDLSTESLAAKLSCVITVSVVGGPESAGVATGESGEGARVGGTTTGESGEGARVGGETGTGGAAVGWAVVGVETTAQPESSAPASVIRASKLFSFVFIVIPPFRVRDA